MVNTMELDTSRILVGYHMIDGKPKAVAVSKFAFTYGTKETYWIKAYNMPLISNLFDLLDDAVCVCKDVEVTQ